VDDSVVVLSRNRIRDDSNEEFVVGEVGRLR
jgi:hypothetical protein